MLVEVKVPTFPESVSEGTILNWYKQPDDVVQRDESLIDLETDKAMMEITAPAGGVIKEIKLGDNSIVHGGEIIAVIEAEEKTKGPEKKEDKTTADTVRTAAEEKIEPRDRPERHEGAGEEESRDTIQIKTTDNIEIKNKIIQQSENAAMLETGERSEQRVPMNKLRQRIAERLKHAQNTAAILTTFNEINMKPVMDLRSRYQEEFQKQYGVKLGYMSFFTKASIEALKKFPLINASIDGTDLVYHKYFDIGIAVSSQRGLVVPILTDADRLSFAQIEKQIGEFGEKAKTGRLTIEEISGGTFTITNGGVFGSLLSTPIINPPQSAILGMHKIEERPIVDNGNIVARPMMYVALSYDHRIIDGHEAVLFLRTIKEAIEDPARILLQL